MQESLIRYKQGTYMGIGNLIKKEDKFSKEYMATVMSQDDPLMRGRLQVKIPFLMGDIPFWVDCSNQIGKVNLQLIPEPEDTVTVKFRNKDIYSGVWELKGNPIDGTEQKQIDPKKYGFYDEQGNCIIIDRANNNIVVTAMNDYNVTVQNCMNIIVTADVNMTVNGNVTETVAGNVNQTISGSVTQNVSGNIDSTSALMSIHNNLKVDGSINATGAIVSDTEVTNSAASVNLGTHTHTVPQAPSGTQESKAPTSGT